MRYFVVCALTLMGFHSAHSEEPRGEIKPFIVLTGQDSKIDEPIYRCCRSNDELKVLWKQHRDYHEDETYWKDQPPTVDFSSLMVVGMFNGKQRSGYGVKVVSVTDEMDCVRIRFRPMTFQPAAVSPFTTTRAERHSPMLSYAFVVIPKADKILVLEENTQSMLGTPPNWTEQSRIPAPNKTTK
ncbi:MAG: hypothetical protein ACJ8C4_14815 [Gemmataceae bacterium]